MGTGGSPGSGASVGGGLGSNPQGGDPIDLASGLVALHTVDLSIKGIRGTLAVPRVYRTLTTNSGAFGLGSEMTYNYELDTYDPQSAQAINLIAPDGNLFLFSIQPNRTFINTTVPWLQGAVLTATGPYVEQGTAMVANLRFKDGTVWAFEVTEVDPVCNFEFSALASITDPNGNQITFTRSCTTITAISDPVGRQLTLTYNSNNSVTSITDPIGRQVKYSYNPSGTLATVTDPDGGVTQYSYDSQDRMTSMIDPRGITTFQNTFDAYGRVIQQVAADGGVYQFAYTLVNPSVVPASDLVVIPASTPAGIPASPLLSTVVTDPLGHQTTYRFNPQGYVIQVTDALGQTTVFNRAPGTNLLLSATGNARCPVCGPPGAGDMSFTYDANGNMLSSTDSLGNTTAYTYDSTFSKVTSVRDPLGNVSRFAYDGAGNLLASTDPNGNTTSFQYNQFGELIEIIDPLNQHATIAYDGLGNPSSVTDPLNNSTQFAYDGISRLTQLTDALGRRTAFAWDALSRPLTRTDALGGATTATWDADNNLVSIKDAKGNTNTFTYDMMNRLVGRSDGLGHSDARTWDTDGNVIKYADRRGETSTFAYDNLNRLITETYSDATVGRSYDAYGRLIQANDSAGGVFNFSYDTAGRLISTATPYGGVNYAYDGRGAMVSRQVNGQGMLSYAYDPAGNLISASMPQASAAFTYNPRSQLSSIIRGNGVSSTYTYDNDAQLVSIVHTKGVATLASDAYTYDAVGNRRSHTTGIGQPLTTPATTNTFNAANQLTQFGSTVDTFDSNGNLVQQSGAATYAWDGRNRLKSIVTSAGQTTNFTYDFAGNLIKQTDSGPTLNLTKSLVLDDLTDIAYEIASDGSSFSVLASRSIDSHLAITQPTGQTLFALTDAINSTVATVDQTGTPQAQFLYEPYGQTTASGAYPFQFTGRTPAPGDLYYNRARFYASQSGRFISEDPLGPGGGIDRYSYVADRPVNLFDPMGLQSSEGDDNYSLCLKSGAPPSACTGLVLPIVKRNQTITKVTQDILPQLVEKITPNPVDFWCLFGGNELACAAKDIAEIAQIISEAYQLVSGNSPQGNQNCPNGSKQ